MKDLCIVILNYATPKLVLDCLETVVPQALNYDSQIVVVDNASPDDSVEVVSRWIAQEVLEDSVCLLVAPENDGFAAGVNTGIRHCDARSYLLLNSDTKLRDGCLDSMMRLLVSNSKIGLVGPRFVTPHYGLQPHTYRDYTGISELLDNAGSLILHSHFSNHTITALPYPSVPTDVSWSEFACILIRREVFETVGLIDEGYFLYFEDVDYCRQARKQNWRVMVEPAAEVVHYSGSSSKLDFETTTRRPRYFYESRTRYFYKCFGPLQLTLANLCWSFGWLLAQLRRLTIGRVNTRLPEKGLADVWTNYLSPNAPPSRNRR